MSVVEVKMCSALRHFINVRLTAAAEEIFSEFEKTIVRYEEEIDRQRRLLDNIWKPQITQHTADVPRQHVCKEEEVLAEQHHCNQNRNFSWDQEDSESPLFKEEQTELCTSLDQVEPEPLQIEEEHEELCSSHKVEQLVVKLETDVCMVIPTCEESNDSEPEPSSYQVLPHTSSVGEGTDQTGSKCVKSASVRTVELKPKNGHDSNSSHSNSVDNSPISESHCDTDKEKKSVKCEVCGKGFKYRSEMKKHHRTHTGEKPYLCNTCGKRFSASSAFKKHKLIHTAEKPYACNYCGKGFTDSTAFKKHTAIHTGETPYSCKICGKFVSSNAILLAHIRTHTGEKPYVCKACRKRFNSMSALKTHMRIHTGEKPYLCNMCGKRFSDSSAFKRHTLIHTGEKPYSCKTCEKTFRHKCHLTAHMRTHTGEKPFPCETCGERFQYATTLKNHIRTHTDEKSQC
ncbi:zinc finger protein 184-like [Acanthochromis polyacanthus]|uniref:zinc finger protein 184-like n=1 Tax=Acanthochromis polyacanthus TaxID=80966 RepID=UPI002234845E|nr:zinc finger protein 184-like [Acanthochromis polyacanthus]